MLFCQLTTRHLKTIHTPAGISITGRVGYHQTKN